MSGVEQNEQDNHRLIVNSPTFCQVTVTPTTQLESHTLTTDVNFRGFPCCVCEWNTCSCLQIRQVCDSTRQRVAIQRVACQPITKRQILTNGRASPSYLWHWLGGLLFRAEVIQQTYQFQVYMILIRSTHSCMHSRQILLSKLAVGMTRLLIVSQLTNKIHTNDCSN